MLDDSLMDELALHGNILDVFNFIDGHVLSDWHHSRPDHLCSPLHGYVGLVDILLVVGEGRLRNSWICGDGIDDALIAYVGGSHGVVVGNVGVNLLWRDGLVDDLVIIEIRVGIGLGDKSAVDGQAEVLRGSVFVLRLVATGDYFLMALLHGFEKRNKNLLLEYQI